MIKKTLFVKDVTPGPVAGPFLVKYAAVATGKNGKPFMNVVLMDSTGEIEAKVWDGVAELAPVIVRDGFVMVEGKCQLYQNRKQLVIGGAKMLREDEIEVKQYTVPCPVDVDALWAQLEAIVDSMQDPFCRALAQISLLEDEDVRARLKRAPAAKSIHHAYPGGLLEHVVSIAGILDGLWKHYTASGVPLDRDLLFIGGFFHDLCKLWELTYDRVTDYSDEGRLIGHLVMGIELVEKKIHALEAQPGRFPGAFPAEKRLLIKHILLAHHGQLEYGSPKRPKCLEALIVHMIDDLDSKVNSIYQFMKADPGEGRWTGLNRQYERFFYKPDSLMGPKSS